MFYCEPKYILRLYFDYQTFYQIEETIFFYFFFFFYFLNKLKFDYKNFQRSFRLSA